MAIIFSYPPLGAPNGSHRILATEADGTDTGSLGLADIADLISDQVTEKGAANYLQMIDANGDLVNSPIYNGASTLEIQREVTTTSDLLVGGNIHIASGQLQAKDVIVAEDLSAPNIKLSNLTAEKILVSTPTGELAESSLALTIDNNGQEELKFGNNFTIKSNGTISAPSGEFYVGFYGYYGEADEMVIIDQLTSLGGANFLHLDSSGASIGDLEIETRLKFKNYASDTLLEHTSSGGIIPFRQGTVDRVINGLTLHADGTSTFVDDINFDRIVGQTARFNGGVNFQGDAYVFGCLEAYGIVKFLGDEPMIDANYNKEHSIHIVGGAGRITTSDAYIDNTTFHGGNYRNLIIGKDNLNFTQNNIVIGHDNEEFNYTGLPGETSWHNFVFGSRHILTGDGGYKTLMGYENAVNGFASGALGAFNGSSGEGTWTIGQYLTADEDNQVWVGRHNEELEFSGVVFGVGIGNGAGANGLVVLESGEVIAPQSHSAVIQNPKALITKEYFENTAVGGGAGTFEPAIDDSITMFSPVGGIEAGTTVGDLRGKALDTLIAEILFPPVFPTFVEPTVSITDGIAYIQEVGTVLSFTLIMSVDLGGIFLNGSKVSNRSNGLEEAVIEGVDKQNQADPGDGWEIDGHAISNHQVVLGTAGNTFSGQVTFSEGDQPVDSYGNNYSTPYGEITKVASTSMNGVYPRYQKNSNGTFSKMSLQSHTISNFTYSQNFNDDPSGQRHAIRIPTAMINGRSVKFQEYNTVAGAYADVANTWAVTDITVDVNANALGVDYKEYIKGGSASGGDPGVPKYKIIFS